jgi:hypothetical protein
VRHGYASTFTGLGDGGTGRRQIGAVAAERLRCQPDCGSFPAALQVMQFPLLSFWRLLLYAQRCECGSELQSR